MTTYFRRVEEDPWVADAPEWLGAGDAVGNQVSDLSHRMTDNTVSIYALPDAMRPTILRAAAALCTPLSKVEEFFYVLFDDTLLSQVSATVEQTPGLTHDELVNGWHRDVVNVSGSLLTRLAVELRELGPERIPMRFLREEVEAELAVGFGGEKRYTGTPNILAHMRKRNLMV